MMDSPDSEPVDMSDGAKLEEMKSMMTPEQVEEFSKAAMESIRDKKPLMYNFKANPSGFMTTEETKVAKDPHGKPMQLRTVTVGQRLSAGPPIDQIVNDNEAGA